MAVPKDTDPAMDIEDEAGPTGGAWGVGVVTTRRAFLWQGGLLTCGLLAGCGASTTTGASSSTGTQGDGGPITVHDVEGTLKLTHPATTIAVQEWQFEEDCLALGTKPVMVADDQGFGQANPLPVQVKGKMGHYKSLGARLSPNLEVLASEPLTLIVVDQTEQQKNYTQFSAIAPTLVLNTDDWSDFYPNLQAIGSALGKSTKAADVEKSIKAQFESAKKKLHPKLGGNGLSALVSVPTNTGFFAFTGNSIQAGVMKSLGLRYAYQDVPSQLTVNLPLPTIASLKPDVIFLAPVPDEPSLVTDTWKGNALWDQLPAVRNNRVFTQDRSIWSVGRGAISVPLMISQTLAALSR